MEEHFKNKLKNHRVDWDKEELLGSLEQELSQKKSRSNWRFLFLLPVLFIATCWGVSESELLFGTRTDLETAESTSTNNSKMKTSTAGVLDLNQTEFKTKAAPKDIHKFAERKKLKETNNSSSSNIQEPNSEGLINSLSPKPDLNKNKPTIFTNKREPIIGNWASQNPIATAANLIQQINNKAVIPDAEILSNKNSSSNSIGHENLKFIELLPLLETTVIPFDTRVSFILAEQKEYPVDSTLNKETSKFKNSFFVSGSGEVGLIHRTTNFQSNDLEFVELLKKNEETITSRNLLSTNLAVEYLHQSGWSLISGLQYQRITESLKYDGLLNTETTTELYNKTFYFFDQNLDTLFFSDTVSTVKTEVRKVRHWNKHTYFNIPLNVGYRRALGRAHIFGTLGISYAFAYNFQGRVNHLYDDGSNEIIDNSKLNFKNRIGYQIAFGLEYPFLKKSQVFVKTSYRRSPNLSAEGKDQFYQSFSLGAGVRLFLSQTK